MADGDFRLIAASGDTIDLNSLTDSLTGVQAVAGMTGFGLPLVEVQYQVGAGDGASFRGQRVSPRDIDIPIYIAGETKVAMREQVNRLARALGGECRLQWEDDRTVWELKVRRVGGGEFSYGTDTDGTSFLQTTITLRAGDPYWKSAEPFVVKKQAGQGVVALPVPGEDMGNATSRPIFKITGPTLGFSIMDKPQAGPGTNTIRYTEFVPAGEVITVDCERGTVTTSSGANVYNNLAPNPRFMEVAGSPDGTQFYAVVDNYSAAFEQAVATIVHQNVVKNPNIRGASTWNINLQGAESWVATIGDSEWQDFERQPDRGLIIFNQYLSTTGLLPSVFANLGNLEVGKQYDLMVSVDEVDLPPTIWTDRQPGTATVYMRMPDAAYNDLAVASWTTTGWAKTSFIATGTTALIEIKAPFAQRQGTWSAMQQVCRIGKVAVVPTGAGYFDGDTPDTDLITYRWAGTPYASVSEAIYDNGSERTAAELNLNMRNWLVV